MFRYLRGVAVAAAVLLAAGVAQANIHVDFSNFDAGDRIEGAGKVQPGLTISSSGDGVALKVGETPALYGAPNGSSSVFNGGLPASGGFGDLDKKHDFVFSFDIPVSLFSLRVLDFGDFNPTRAVSHEFGIKALYSGGSVISSVAYSSDNKINPTTGDFGNLFVTGDAVTAASGQPGNVVFNFSGRAFTSFELFYKTGGVVSGPSDPNIAFADLKYAPVPLPAAAWLMLAALAGLLGVRQVRAVRTTA